MLTGSTDIQSLPTVSESLAGRIAKIRLRPLAQGEIERTSSRLIDSAFKQSFPRSHTHHDRDAVMEIAFRGGFPEPMLLQSRSRKRWHTDYMNALLERDLKIDQVRLDSDRSGKLIETFAFNEIMAQIDASNGRYELFHYRDREKREIDFLVEREDNALLGIEIKAGSAVEKKDCQSYAMVPEKPGKKPSIHRHNSLYRRIRRIFRQGLVGGSFGSSVVLEHFVGTLLQAIPGRQTLIGINFSFECLEQEQRQSK